MWRIIWSSCADGVSQRGFESHRCRFATLHRFAARWNKCTVLVRAGTNAQCCGRPCVIPWLDNGILHTPVAQPCSLMGLRFIFRISTLTLVAAAVM